MEVEGDKDVGGPLQPGTEVIMVANPGLLASETLEADEVLVVLVRRGTTMVEGPARKGDESSRSGGPGAEEPLQAYAAFVLEQEALYCQR
jgi:hypothetical protein